jgi:hypothetical protein
MPFEAGGVDILYPLFCFICETAFSRGGNLERGRHHVWIRITTRIVVASAPVKAIIITKTHKWGALEMVNRVGISIIVKIGSSGMWEGKGTKKLFR